MSLEFSLERGRKVDLDNLVRPAVAGLRDAGVYPRGLRGLDSLTALREHADGGELLVSAHRLDPPGDAAWEAQFDELPPTDRPVKWVKAWDARLKRLVVPKLDPDAEGFVDIRINDGRRSLVDLLEPILDGMQPWLGRDPAGRSTWCPKITGFAGCASRACPVGRSCRWSPGPRGRPS